MIFIKINIRSCKYHTKYTKNLTKSFILNGPMTVVKHVDLIISEHFFNKIEDVGA